MKWVFYNLRQVGTVRRHSPHSVFGSGATFIKNLADRGPKYLGQLHGTPTQCDNAITACADWNMLGISEARALRFFDRENQSLTEPDLVEPNLDGYTINFNKEYVVDHWEFDSADFLFGLKERHIEQAIIAQRYDVQDQLKLMNDYNTGNQTAITRYNTFQTYRTYARQTASAAWAIINP